MDISKQRILLLNELLRSDSSETSDDEELEIYLATVPFLKEEASKSRYFVEKVISKYSAQEFKHHFRMRSPTVQKIMKDFKHSNYAPRTTNHLHIPLDYYIFVFLWFAGSRCSMRQIAIMFEISISMCFRIIKIVIEYLNDRASQVIQFPETYQEKDDSSVEFFKISSFPDTIGCIDKCFIDVHIPPDETSSCVALQGICNENKMFLDVFVGEPNKIRESQVYENSPISRHVNTVCEGKYIILGDSSYDIREWLMTPYTSSFKHMPNKVQFNKKILATQAITKHTLNLLKSRFPQLNRIEIADTNTIKKFIVSCCVLHNICLKEKDIYDEDNEQNYIELDLNAHIPVKPKCFNRQENILRQKGERKRDLLCDVLAQNF